MLWLFIPVMCLLMALLYFLFAPLFVEVDSEIGLCRARLHRIASVALRFSENTLILDLHVAGWKKPIDLLENREKTMRKEVKERRTKPVKRHRTISLQKVLAVLRSFKVRICQVTTDTGDMPLNGMLYPVFYWLSAWSGKAFRISFNDENEIKLEIQNNLAHMLWAYFRAK